METLVTGNIQTLIGSSLKIIAAVKDVWGICGN
jgi:hypothetical protein